MEVTNDLLLIGVVLILVALLFSRKQGAATSSQSELQWLRRKIDLIALQTNFMLKHSGALSKPPRQVCESLKKGDDVHAIQKMREETGLTAKEAQAVVEAYKKQINAA